MIHHYTQYCKRTAKCCCGCERKIPIGKVMVKTIYWRPGYKRAFFYFFSHWVKKEQEWFKNHPYVHKVGTGGRKRLQIDDTQRVKRRKILCRYAKYMQMKRIYLSRDNAVSDPKVMQLVAKYNMQIDELKIELEDCGGTPKSWT
jgi:hypothetical protein